jgi:hypothetical protein
LLSKTLDLHALENMALASLAAANQPKVVLKTEERHLEMGNANTHLTF